MWYRMTEWRCSTKSAESATTDARGSVEGAVVAGAKKDGKEKEVNNGTGELGSRYIPGGSGTTGDKARMVLRGAVAEVGGRGRGREEDPSTKSPRREREPLEEPSTKSRRRGGTL